MYVGRGEVKPRQHVLRHATVVSLQTLVVKLVRKLHRSFLRPCELGAKTRAIARMQSCIASSHQWPVDAIQRQAVDVDITL